MKSKCTILAVVVLLLLTAAISFGQCRNANELRGKFHNFSSAQQAKIWRNHYRFALKTEENLSQEGKDIISEAINLTKDDMYNATSDKSDFVALGKRAALIFTNKDQLKRIFYSLTSEEMRGFSLVPASYLTMLEEGADCSCNISDNVLCDYCESRIKGHCEVSDWGCGFGWLLPCDGNCRYYNQ
jgi:hypothetical protein